jgi:hypothetical protein
MTPLPTKLPGERKPKNLMARSVKPTHPYEVWMSGDGTWVWLVLKKYQADDYAPYARAFCAVTSPHTYGEGELGDVYLADIRQNAHRIEDDPGIVRHLINMRLGKLVELSLAAASKVVGHPLTITEVGA